MAFSSLRSRVIPLCHRSFSAKPSYRGAKGRGTPVIDSDNETSEEDVPISGISRQDYLRNMVEKASRPVFPELRNQLEKASSSSSSRADRDKEGLMFDSDKQTPEDDVPTSGISRPVFPELRNQLKKASSSSSSSSREDRDKEGLMFDSDKLTPEDDVPTSGISRPLSEILKELNKKVPDSLIKYRHEPNGVSLKYIPWHIVNRIMNLHAPEWSGEVRSVTHSPDGKSVSVVYRVTIYGTDAEIYRESTGTASVDDPGYGDPVQKAEGMAFRRACARFGLGLHLYHEDMS